MLRVLMFLFENYNEQQSRLISDQDILSDELERAGFNQFEIHDALAWLQGFRDFEDAAKAHPAISDANVRFYEVEEVERICAQARSLLLFLEQSGILTPHMREMVIDRAMAMDEFIDAPQMKWIILITLFYHPSQKKALDWMQDLVIYGDVMH